MIQTPTSGDYSLYFHIPFCTKKCDYCHFFVLPNKDDLKENLLQGFDLELARIQPEIAQKKLISIYFGGGTPSLFGPARINHLLNQLPSAEEITLELNPELCTLSLLKEYKEVGINRISIGIQSFAPSHLVMLGRTHTATSAIQSVENACEAGFTNISIDLMYDLPHQTLSEWESSLAQAARLPITHLSLYNLTIEPHTVFFKYRKTLEKHLPEPEVSQAMYESAQRILSSSGLHQYEISAFAKPGFHSIHNTGYWLARPFLGLGPSAFSFWNNSRFRNVANLNKYLHALQNNKSPVDFEETLSPSALERELFLVAVRLLQGTPLPSFPITEQIEKGYLRIENNLVKLTPKGILFYDTVAEELV